MSIANKVMYPLGLKHDGQGILEWFQGINFKEALILHLATNPNIVSLSSELNNQINLEMNAKLLLQQANAIIEELDMEK